MLLQDIETGTRSKKRTMVPFLYNIPEVENFDVIDFPAVDDQDGHITELVHLLHSLSQLVVFVVNYRFVSKSVMGIKYNNYNMWGTLHLAH